MHQPDGLSATHEMYLKVLYRLQEENDVGRVRDLAKGLGVTAGTVSAVLKKLEKSGLLAHDHYGAVKLTTTGLLIAECIVRRFETMKAFLTEVLGLDEETAEVDACEMEHSVSPVTVNRLERLVEMVRSGALDLASARRDLPVIHTEVCSECEAAGVCQAVSAWDTKQGTGAMKN